MSSYKENPMISPEYVCYHSFWNVLSSNTMLLLFYETEVKYLYSNIIPKTFRRLYSIFLLQRLKI